MNLESDPEIPLVLPTVTQTLLILGIIQIYKIHIIVIL
jgi:hypothetical protein